MNLKQCLMSKITFCILKKKIQVIFPSPEGKYGRNKDKKKEKEEEAFLRDKSS